MRTLNVQSNKLYHCQHDVEYLIQKLFKNNLIQFFSGLVKLQNRINLIIIKITTLFH